MASRMAASLSNGRQGILLDGCLSRQLCRRRDAGKIHLAVDWHHNDQVQKAPTHRRVSNIGAPDLVGPLDRKLAGLLATVAEDVGPSGQRLFLPASDLVDSEHLRDLGRFRVQKPGPPRRSASWNESSSCQPAAILLNF